jgi:hypothetical protein
MNSERPTFGSKLQGEVGSGLPRTWAKKAVAACVCQSGPATKAVRPAHAVAHGASASRRGVNAPRRLRWRDGCQQAGRRGASGRVALVRGRSGKHVGQHGGSGGASERWVDKGAGKWAERWSVDHSERRTVAGGNSTLFLQVEE